MKSSYSFLAVAALAATLALVTGAPAQDPQHASDGTLRQAAADFESRVEQSVAELAALREQIAAEQVPLSRRLSELEAELSALRRRHTAATRSLDGRALELANLRTTLDSRERELSYVVDLLAEYARSYEARLHVTELQRAAAELRERRAVIEDPSLPAAERLDAATDLLGDSVDRLAEIVGGATFDGTAIGPDGFVHEGRFALIGPAAFFVTGDGRLAGTAAARSGTLEPAVAPFTDEADAAAAAAWFERGDGLLPVDPTLGDAHELAATQQTLAEHVEAGGPVMLPIVAMAVLVLLVALYKWIELLRLRRPTRASLDALLEAVGRGDPRAAAAAAERVRGPTGPMLASGVAHLGEPRELVEEAMYESVLATRLRAQRFLPFLAIAAASAPLLGLLGTVTGIIDTFKMITVFGSGDVKMLSGGISEALITTEFGLVVAIPSLLLHAWLTRKARAVVGSMERAALAFANEACRHAEPAGAAIGATAPDPDAVRAQVGRILDELLAPLVESGQHDERVPT